MGDRLGLVATVAALAVMVWAALRGNLCLELAAMTVYLVERVTGE